MFNVIAFDADDTLWHNENKFINIQNKFCDLLSAHENEFIKQKLSKRHIKNLEIFGYGIKGFIFSMIETFIEMSDGKVKCDEIQQIINFGKEILSTPIELLPNVFDVLNQLSKEYFLMLITKGDLIDQEKKIECSGLSDFFNKIEIVSEKTIKTYKKILIKYEIEASHFLMVGNSMRSDVVPLIQIGAHAIHIPYETTWEHEKDHPNVDSEKFSVLGDISLLPEFLKNTK